MLTKWTLSNFKSVRRETELRLSPLTIFAGANSSGKSTIIQSILLTAQTIQSPVHGRSVVLNGHIVRLGGYGDIVSDPNTDKPIGIGFELRPPKGSDSTVSDARVMAEAFGYLHSGISERTASIECSFAFSRYGPAREGDILELQPRLVSSRTKINYNDGEKQAESEISIARADESPYKRAGGFNLDASTLTSNEIESLEYEVLQPQRLRPGRRYRGLGITANAKCAGGVLSHFLPLRLSVVFDAVDEETRRYFEILLSSSWPDVRQIGREAVWKSNVGAEFSRRLVEIFASLIGSTGVDALGTRAMTAFEQIGRSFTPENYQRLFHTLPPPIRHQFIAKLAENESSLREIIRAGRSPKYVLQFEPLPPETQFAIDYVKSYFHGKVKYLGPLRDEPKSVYPLSGATDPRDVGYRGEHTAAVLDLHKSTIVEYITPRFLEASAGDARTNAPLLEAVMDWLSYMGVVQQVKTTDLGKLGHELRVSTTDAPTLHDLTHVGVGVSQLLPILVLALLAEPDSALIFEQPELHLHPRVQTRLADFFVSLIAGGKQCLVETHSEYLINRLRYLAAVSSGQKVSSDVTMYFVEKADGQSRYSEVRINEYGAIPKWPKGFFDENEELSAAILKAAMDKRTKTIRQ